MSDRIVVSGACATPCASCVSCDSEAHSATLDEVLDRAGPPDLTLGGGDATRWPHLHAFLAANNERPAPQRIWVEAPASSFTPAVLRDLAIRGVFGLRVQIEGLGQKMLQFFKLGDGEKVIAEAEALGLQTQARIVVRPKTFPIVAGLANRLFPRPIWLELIRQDWGGPMVTLPPDLIEKIVNSSINIEFSAHRRTDSGYLPPCVLPQAWRQRQRAWRATLNPQGTKENTALPQCATCALNKQCQWNDPDALDAEARAAARPLVNLGLKQRQTETPVPEIIIKQRPDENVICVTPWTTMEIVDPNGQARQCCSTWTNGHRGTVLHSSMADVWNGPGYQQARRIMSGKELDELCLPICSRLHDKKFAEKKFTIQKGTDAFVKNQILMAEEIAQRKEIIQSKPLYIALCPSTYCNYNCIMCDHGRSPRRDLPDSIWDELPELLPTVKSLTLLGGEPLANHHTWEFLRKFDIEKYPDATLDLVTNGSLLTAANLKKIEKCPFGDITISFNAGGDEEYLKVQRAKIPFQQLLKHLDGLIAFRESRPWWFGITLSFVVQPASAHTLIAFGQIAHERNVRIRLMALNPENHDGLDFYTDPDEVARVVEHVDKFIEWVKRVRPEWLHEVKAARQAVVEEAASRKVAPGGLITLGTSRLSPTEAMLPR